MRMIQFALSSFGVLALYDIMLGVSGELFLIHNLGLALFYLLLRRPR